MAVLSNTRVNGHSGFGLYIEAAKVYVRLSGGRDRSLVLVHTKLPLSREKWHHVFVTYDGSGVATGLRVFVDGMQRDLEIEHDQLSSSILTEALIDIGGREGEAFSGSLDDIRIYARTLSPDEVDNLAAANPLFDILKKAPEDRSDREWSELVEACLSEFDGTATALAARRQELLRRKASLEGQFPHTLVMQEREERRDAYVLVRGQYDQKGKRVLPGVPGALPAVLDKSRNRLALARWLVDPGHPLTARVAVNRIWQQHFGVGLVESAEDFGAQGRWPSHPDLLDYLASRLIESDWDVKAMHRLIVTSATFRQSSQISPVALERDPNNRYLARGPRFRLDAETIRDLALHVSGLLVGEIGGPSVKPYQPGGLWEAVGYPTSTTANFKRDTGAKLYRRGMYTFWKRTSPPPSMQILDAPSREVCTVRRQRTNTPGTALLLMNDIQFVEAARKFAERILQEGGNTVPERIGFAYETALSRLPSAHENSVLAGAVSQYRAVYESEPTLAEKLLAQGDSPAHPRLDHIELSVWTMVASTLLNLDETISQH